jgi:hypothetical protein
MNNYGQQFNGMAYGNNAPQNPTMSQLLSPEEMSEIQKAPQAFQTKLTRDEYLRALCTHKDQNGNIKLEKLADGRYHCPICNSDFNLIDLNSAKGDIEQICLNMNDLYQSIKTYLPNPTSSMRDIYMMIAFFNKIPQLWGIAKNAFEKITNVNGVLQPADENNAFQILGNIFNQPGFGGLYPNNFQAGIGNPAMMYNAAPTTAMYNTQQFPNQGMMQNPAQTMPKFPSPNPIGTVEAPQDFTANQQATYTVNPNVAAAPAAANPNVAPVPTPDVVEPAAQPQA